MHKIYGCYGKTNVIKRRHWKYDNHPMTIWQFANCHFKHILLQILYIVVPNHIVHFLQIVVFLFKFVNFPNFGDKLDYVYRYR